tara:strand:- start:123 stop:530 length:408 start_codon:yes stop_codon:yes gene_type:complete
MEPVKITKLEKQLLTDIAHSDHSSDGNGFTMWVTEDYVTLPMRQVRALLTTLQEKGVIAYEPPCDGWPGHVGPLAPFIEGGERRSGQRSDGSTWYHVEPDHQKFPEKYCQETHTFGDPFEDGCFGYRYMNLEVVE